MAPKGLTVSRLARLAGVSVRTLHHYDEIGLLKPGGRAANGYRLYEQVELQRLQQILFYRALDFPLDDIARLMNDPAFDARAALLEQKRALEQRAERTARLIDAINHALEGEVMFNAFEKEAEEKWGDTPQFKESKRRTARYTKKDWAQMKADADAIQQALAALMDGGVKPTDVRAMDLAERHRQHISKWFYDCSYEIHYGLAEMYVADSRFTENIDRVRQGLAAYQRASILANCDRAAG